MASIGAVGSFFDGRADAWDVRAEPCGVKHLTVAQLAGVREGSRVLDVGCGTGIMEQAYMQLGASSIVALDVSEKMIANAKRRFADVPEGTLRFECADVVRFECPEPFDSVVIYNAYPHIMDREALVEAVSRLLVSGGRFLVAHGMSRAELECHHSSVPENVTSYLPPVEEAVLPWKKRFVIDEMADTSFMFFFGGTARGNDR